MMSRLIISLLLTLAFSTHLRGETVLDFALLDQFGRHHQLSYYQDKRAIVLMVQGNGCPIVRHLLTDFRELQDRFEKRNVLFLMINANTQDTRQTIRREAEEWGIDVPVLIDESQMVAKSLGIRRTAEVFVIEPRSMDLLYRGPLNDRVNYEVQKTQADHNYVADVLNALVKNRDLPTHSGLRSPGCLVNLQYSHASPSFSQDVVPILRDNCMECHRAGGAAPWAMVSHTMIEGFAPMIREVLLTKRMPPWHADPETGQFANNRFLSSGDLATLVTWIDAGARLDGPDPLPEIQAPQKNTEEPDVVIDLPAFNIPATGIVEYKYFSLANPLEEARWIKGIRIVPGNTQVLHHMFVGVSKPEDPYRARIERAFNNYIGVYTPGSEPTALPDDGGIYLAPGDSFEFQVHYTAIGRKVVDQSRLEVFFHQSRPEFPVHFQAMIDTSLLIPRHTSNHSSHTYILFERDAEIYSLFPHAHYRGKHARFLLKAPSGETTTLLSVPNYSFNWQRVYHLDSPLVVAAGSKIIFEMTYDNSSNNTANPDPDTEVAWGYQSEDEMLFGGIRYRWLGESLAHRVHDRNRMRHLAMFGALDKDIDGFLTLNEPDRLSFRARLVRLNAWDTDNDRRVSLEEYIRAMTPDAMIRRRTANE